MDMETKTKIHFRYCIVLTCSNTTVTTPDKQFFTVPKLKKIGNKWCKIMKRKESIADKSVRYCCEDHFDLITGTENGLPGTICYLCYRQLQRCCTFCDMAQKSNRTLQNMLQYTDKDIHSTLNNISGNHAQLNNDVYTAHVYKYP